MGGPLGEGGLNRSKKTPEELAAEAEGQDDFTSKCSLVYSCIEEKRREYIYRIDVNVEC